MTNHVHLPCTPQQAGGESNDAISWSSICAVFNYQFQRSGSLWEGRYKSCLVQAEHYFIEVYRYIEMNPVRAPIW
jgi:putative transposase